jgi:hypothetical protein
MRMLKTLEIIVANLTFDEINYFLEDVKEELFEKLYEILREAKINDMDWQKHNNDPVFLTLKLLGRLGQISRTYKNKLEIKTKKFTNSELKFVLNIFE